MLEKVIMPTLGLGMEEAVIIQWLKREGEAVEKDEPLLSVETDKATSEINAPATGILRQIAYQDGATVPVTKTIAYIETGEPGSAGETPVEPDGEAASESPDRIEPSERQQAPRLHERNEAIGEEGRGLRASPAARRLARDLDIDLSQVPGTGPGGRIQGEDVRRSSAALKSEEAAQKPETPVSLGGLPGRLVPFSRKRRVTAERMSASARSVARVTLNVEVDAQQMIDLRSRLHPTFQEAGVRLTYDAMLAKMVAEALAAHPEINARWTDQGIYYVEQVNVGVAMAVDDGLVVPVIREANKKRLIDVARDLGEMAAKAKEDRLTAGDMTGGTFTITNLGMFGVDFFTPLVNPPECAILGVGRMAERPVGRNGELVLRPTMMLSLSFDHRVVDGAPAGRFLQKVQHLIEEPYLLI